MIHTNPRPTYKRPPAPSNPPRANHREREEIAYTTLAMLRVLQQQLAVGLSRSAQRELSETIKELLHDLPRL